MKALAAALVASLLLTACATRPGPGPENRREFYERRVLRANPGQVIATELALARAAREKGQWTAFAEYAAANAVMFQPGPINARDWLRRQVNPPQPLSWQPHQVWSSCDGTLAVTRGAWQRPDGSTGYFTTVWERQRNGEYKWVMNQGDVLGQPLAAPDMIGGTSAMCRSQPTPPAEMLAGPADTVSSGASRDGALRWHVVARPDGSRTVTASYWDGDAWRDAVHEQVAAK